MARQADSNLTEAVVQVLCENERLHMAEAMRIMLNEVMRIERAQVI